MCQLDLKAQQPETLYCLKEPPVPLITIFSSFSAIFLVFPIFLGPCNSVLCRSQLCSGTRGFVWLVSIWFPYIAQVSLEKISLYIFPGNRIKALSRFSALIYLFLLAVEGASNGIHVCRREGSTLLGNVGSSIQPKASNPALSSSTALPSSEFWTLCLCFYPAVPSFFESWDLSLFCFIFPQIFLLPPVTAAEHIFTFVMVFSVFLTPVLAPFLL